MSLPYKQGLIYRLYALSGVESVWGEEEGLALMREDRAAEGREWVGSERGVFLHLHRYFFRILILEELVVNE